eukprot:TRINITY_DN212_c0_g1_i1.p1 TRINITY_DN212_c0_g1~~TRINITY_DN212_c0_g1_i1.p1  ORF type:complete len:380 (-),score=177.27 TRINITY_DN212_c0_g1_i1:378-1517(-)
MNSRDRRVLEIFGDLGSEKKPLVKPSKPMIKPSTPRKNNGIDIIRLPSIQRILSTNLNTFMKKSNAMEFMRETMKSNGTKKTNSRSRVRRIRKSTQKRKVATPKPQQQQQQQQRVDDDPQIPLDKAFDLLKTMLKSTSKSTSVVNTNQNSRIISEPALKPQTPPMKAKHIEEKSEHTTDHNGTPNPPPKKLEIKPKENPPVLTMEDLMRSPAPTKSPRSELTVKPVYDVVEIAKHRTTIPPKPQENEQDPEIEPIQQQEQQRQQQQQQNHSKNLSVDVSSEVHDENEMFENVATPTATADSNGFDATLNALQGFLNTLDDDEEVNTSQMVANGNTKGNNDSSDPMNALQNLMLGLNTGDASTEDNVTNDAMASLLSQLA